MKKRTKPTSGALTTAIVMLPVTLAVPLHAQRPPPDQVPVGAEAAQVRAHIFMKFADRFVKLPTTYSVVGMDNEHTIYRNAKNEYFYIDPATGDMQFLSVDMYLKFSQITTRSTSTEPLRLVKWNGVKFGGEVSIIGVDAQGHVVQKNARGEMFYLNPNTGDMVFVK